MAQGVPGLRVARQAAVARRDGIGPSENRVARREARTDTAADIGGAEVVVQRPAHVQSGARVPGHATGVAHRGRESAFDDAVPEYPVAGPCLRFDRVPQERQQIVVQLNAEVVVQPPQHADPHPLDPEPRVEQPARAPEPELIFGDQFRRLAQIDAQRVLADPEHDVVSRRRRLFHLEVNREVEQGVDREDRIESRGVGVEGRIGGEVGVIVQELDDAEGNRDRQPGPAAAVGRFGHRAVRGVITGETGGAAQAEAAHPDPPRVEDQPLTGGLRRHTDRQGHEPDADHRDPHDAPR